MTKLEKVLAWIANGLLILNIFYFTYMRWKVEQDVGGKLYLSEQDVRNGVTQESMLNEILMTYKLIALVLGLALGIAVVATFVVKKRLIKAVLFLIASFIVILMYVDLTKIIISTLYVIVAIKMFMTKIVEPKLEKSFN